MKGKSLLSMSVNFHNIKHGKSRTLLEQIKLDYRLAHR